MRPGEMTPHRPPSAGTADLRRAEAELLARAREVSKRITERVRQVTATTRDESPGTGRTPESTADR